MPAKQKQAKQMPQKRKAAKPAPANLPATANASRWLQLLRDPCSAPLTRPCYPGIDAGMLVRTVDVIRLTGNGYTGLTPGGKAKLNGVYSYTPARLTDLYGTYSGGSPGWSGEVYAGGFDNFVTATPADNGVVESIRPVAACMKFIPTGDYSTRSGTIGSIYSTRPLFEGTTVPSFSQVYQTAQHFAAVGSEPHEIRWLPTSDDSDFRFNTLSKDSRSNAGTISFCFQNIDAVATDATHAIAEGYIEVITVWEWTPKYTSGLVKPIITPDPTPLSTVLARISDPVKFCTSPVSSRQSFLTGGTVISGYRSNPMV